MRVQGRGDGRRATGIKKVKDKEKLNEKIKESGKDKEKELVSLLPEKLALPAGVRVEIRGLQGAAQHNGKWGTVKRDGDKYVGEMALL